METKTFNEEELLLVAGVLSDVQEMIGLGIDEKTIRGKINLVKGYLFGSLEIVQEGLFFRFKSKNENSRFCDKCGLLKVSEYKQCGCIQEVLTQ